MTVVNQQDSVRDFYTMGDNSGGKVGMRLVRVGGKDTPEEVALVH